MSTVAIDVQGHFMPDVRHRAITEHAARDAAFATLMGPLIDIPASAGIRRLDDERVAAMSSAGIDVQVISSPGVGVGDRERSAALATEVNAAMVEAAARYPGRFMVLGSLPLPDVAASLAEIDRLASEPRVRGVLVDASTVGYTLEEPQFEPLYSRLAEQRMAVMLHPPIERVPSVYAEWGLAHSVATMMSTTLGALRLIFSGMLDRVPTLELVVPHLGGTLPYLLQRVTDLNGRGEAEHDLLHYCRNRLYYDSCSYHPPALRCAIETVGAERIMLGSDYPFRGALDVCVRDIAQAGLPQRERDAIMGETAARWFAPDPAAAIEQG